MVENPQLVTVNQAVRRREAAGAARPATAQEVGGGDCGAHQSAGRIPRPAGLEGSRLAAKLQAIAELDLEELHTIDPRAATAATDTGGSRPTRPNRHGHIAELTHATVRVSPVRVPSGLAASISIGEGRHDRSDGNGLCLTGQSSRRPDQPDRRYAVIFPRDRGLMRRIDTTAVIAGEGCEGLPARRVVKPLGRRDGDRLT